VRQYLNYDIIDDLKNFRLLRKNNIKNNFIKAFIDETKTSDDDYMQKLKQIIISINTSVYLKEALISLTNLKMLYLEKLEV
jgi:hypothetical protein